MVQTVKRALAKLVQQDQTQWSRALVPVLLSLRAMDSATTGYSPAQILYGRDLCLPADLRTCPPLARKADKTAGYPLKLRNTLREIHRQAAAHRKDASRAMKHRYDLNARLSSFKVGDKVWLYNPRRRVGITPTLQFNWDRGWIITHVINDVVVRIRRKRDDQLRVVHIDRIAADTARPDPGCAPLLSIYFVVAWRSIYKCIYVFLFFPSW